MANTFTLSGTSLDAQNNPAYVGRYMVLRVTSVGTDTEDQASYPQDSVSAEIQSDGTWSFSTLWVNGDSGVLSYYEMLEPSGQRIEFVFPSAVEGTTVRYEYAIENYLAEDAAEQTSPALAAHIADLDNPHAVTPTQLGLVIGTDVQAWDTKLDDIAALTPTDGNFIVGNGTTWVAESGNTAQASLGLLNGVATEMGTTATASDTGNGSLALGAGSAATTASGAFSAAISAGGGTSAASGTGSYQIGPGTNSTGSSIQFLSSGSVTATEFGRLIGTSGALYYVGGTDVAVADGGTGASDAATARTNLGVSATADTLLVANDLSDVNDAATARTNLDLYSTSETDAAISDANAAGNQGKQVIRSITFPTTSDYLSVADDATLDVGTGDFSIFFTCRIDSDSGTESIIYKYSGGKGYQVQFLNGSLQLIMNDGVEDTFTLASGMDDDKWHVYVITVDRSGNATAYIDNVAQTPVDVTSAALTLDNSGQVQIGLNGASNPLANGAMASYVGLTKDLITTAEIADASFDTTRLKDLSDLSLCVDMSQLQIATFDDRSSNAHAVTVNGTLTYNDDRGDLQVANSTVIVRTAADLSGTLSSDVVYLVDGEIDMGTQAITVPSGGLEIGGYGLNVSKLTSTENSYTMFVDSASDAGNLFLSDITVDVSGTSSQVFDLDNSGANGAVEMNTINFENCTSLGTLDAYRQFLLFNSFWNNCDDGITFAGTWAGGASIRTFLVRNFGATGTVFTGSTSPALTFGSRFICDGNINVPSGATVYDFEASMFTNDAGFELITGEYSGDGTVIAVKSPVIDNTSTKSRHRDNNGMMNTYVGGRWYIDTGDSTATTISTQDTYVKAAGTTTEEDLQWFSSSGDNDLTYDSTQTVEVQIAGSINVSAVSGGSDKNITLTLRHWDDSAGAYVDLPNKAKGVSTSAGTFHNIGIIGYASMDTDDRIELWIENNSDTVNLTVDEGSLLSISERAN